MKRVLRSMALALASVSAFGLAGSPAAFGVTPKKGGTLVFARGGDSVGLDPANESDGESLNVADQIFDSLVRLKNGTTEVEPGLAASWTVSMDCPCQRLLHISRR